MKNLFGSDITSYRMGAMDEPLFLITGAAGYLGRHVVAHIGNRGSVYSTVHRPSEPMVGDVAVLDIADRDAVFDIVESVQPTAIIHTAAVNPGQGDEVDMMRINADGSRHVAEAAQVVGARLVAVSTDIVHDGLAGPYSDDAPATPINAYGRSKAAGEDAVLGVDPSAVVVRTSLMYGLDEIDRGTASFADRLSRGEVVSLFSDVLRNPVPVDILAEALLRLTGVRYSGVLNVAGRQALSREDFGLRVLDYWGVETDGVVNAVLAADMSNSIPLDVRLDSSRAENLLNMTFPGVDEFLSSTPN
jgi:dTDP-4-dehydrorhamnose reductase